MRLESLEVYSESLLESLAQKLDWIDQLFDSERCEEAVETGVAITTQNLMLQQKLGLEFIREKHVAGTWRRVPLWPRTKPPNTLL